MYYRLSAVGMGFEALLRKKQSAFREFRMPNAGMDEDFTVALPTGHATPPHIKPCKLFGVPLLLPNVDTHCIVCGLPSSCTKF